jgi:hypothetical protein
MLLSMTERKMLRLGDPNPLAVWGLRQLKHCPPHFTKICFDVRVEDKKITDWIWSNLSGRFYIGEYYHAVKKMHGTMIVGQKCVAFEDAGEASVFALILDTINQSDRILW